MHKSGEGESIFKIEEGRRRASVIGNSEILDLAGKTGALDQLLNISELPGIFMEPVGLPDIHQGYGFPIGAVAAFTVENGIVSPGGIGYDINCGVSLFSTGLRKSEISGSIKDILENIWNLVPVGIKKSIFKPNADDMQEIIGTGLKWAVSNGYSVNDDMMRTEHSGIMNCSDTSSVSEMAIERGRNYIGTLGSGNHFIEIQFADRIYDHETATRFGIEEGMLYVMIHSGSRGLGHQVAVDYIEEIKQKFPEQKVPDEQLRYAPLGTATADRYLSAMNGAANYGFVNRQIMMANVRKSFRSALGDKFDYDSSKLVYSLSHNIATFEKFHGGKEILVHRKGATAAFGPGEAEGIFRETGHPILVPGSMGTRSYVMVGNAGTQNIAFSSSCHGAGRILSRKKAKEIMDYNEVISNLSGKGISIKTDSHYSVLEEAPQSYKDIDQVVSSMEKSGISRPVASLFPIGVIKG